MTDLEITRACAEAMGWVYLGPYGILKELDESNQDYISRAGKKAWCLSGHNDWWSDPKGNLVCGPCQMDFDPLHDDAQALAIVKKLRLAIGASSWGHEAHWVARLPYDNLYETSSFGSDLNRCICEAAAKVQIAKRTESESEKQ